MIYIKTKHDVILLLIEFIFIILINSIYIKFYVYKSLINLYVNETNVTIALEDQNKYLTNTQICLNLDKISDSYLQHIL